MHFFALALDISQIPLKFAVGASWMRRFMNSPMNFLSASSQGTSRVLQAHAGIPTKPGSPVSKSGILLPTNFLSSAQSLARSLLRVFFLPLPFPCAPRRLGGGVELLVVVEVERRRVGDLDLVRGGVLTWSRLLTLDLVSDLGRWRSLLGLLRLRGVLERLPESSLTSDFGRTGSFVPGPPMIELGISG